MYLLCKDFAEMTGIKRTRSITVLVVRAYEKYIETRRVMSFGLLAKGFGNCSICGMGISI
jgi:hypothetical protein